MQAYKLETVVPQDHHLEITLPESFPAGDAEVIVLAIPGREGRAHEAGQVESPLDALLAWQRAQPVRLRSREDVEAQVRDERDGWDD